MIRMTKTERKKLRGQEVWREIGIKTVIDQGGRQSCDICTQEGKGSQVSLYWNHPVPSAGTDARTEDRFVPHSF